MGLAEAVGGISFQAGKISRAVFSSIPFATARRTNSPLFSRVFPPVLEGVPVDYALVVRGDSMVSAGIDDGDIA
ncbi:hypothetical protein V3F56_10315 [Moorellaceae bacterium AZ2]